MSNSQIQRQVECPICFDQFTTPKVLPCQHTFCLRCLESHHRSNGGGNRVCCPECRTQHNLPSNRISEFPTSVAIQRLIEALSAPNVPQQQPSAPPLPLSRSQDNNTRNVQRRGSDDDLDIDRVISLVDQQRELERNVNRNQTDQNRSVWTTEESHDHASNEQNERHTNNRNTESDASGDRCTFAYVRRIYRKYLGKLFQDFGWVMTLLSIHIVFMTFSRFIAGAIKLSSDCPDESNAAVYLFVKSWFECFLHVTILVFIFKQKLERALDNLFVQIWLLIQTIFSFAWLIVGTAWVFGNYKDMTVECPLYVEDWDFHFINFALFLTVIDWIIVVIFIIYSLYVIFEMYEGVDSTENSE
ncbi:hypothetical protein ACF0H5_023393 [Mactra antiquata]